MRRRSRLEGRRSGKRRVLLHRFALGGFALPLFLAGFGFAVEGLRHCRRTAHFAQLQNLDVKLAAFVFDAQHVADADIARGLGFNFVGVDAAQVAGLGSEGARLEKARSPQPLVDANGVCGSALPSRDLAGVGSGSGV